MKRRTLAIIILCIAATLTVYYVYSRSAFPPPPENTATISPGTNSPLPFLPGEKASYEASGLIKAQCELTNTRSDNGNLIVAYKVTTSRSELGGTTSINPKSLQPISAEKWSNKRDRQGKRTITQFGPQLRTAHIIKHRPYKTEKEKQLREEDVELDGHVDLMTALTILRTQRPALDQPVKFAIVAGDDFSEMIIQKLGEGPLELPIGKYEALQLLVRIRKLTDKPTEEHDPWRNATVWVTKDTWLPLQFDLPGTTANLVRYEPGTGEW